MSPNLFLQKRKQQYLDKLKEVKNTMGTVIVVTQWLHIYSANSQKVTFCDFCLTFDP